MSLIAARGVNVARGTAPSSKLAFAPVPRALVSRPKRATRVSVFAQEKQNGVLVKANDYVAVGGMENPGNPEVRARIDSGGRLPSTCFISA